MNSGPLPRKRPTNAVPSVLVAWLIAASTVVFPQPARCQFYKITDLGAGKATAVNNAGWVVVNSCASEICDCSSGAACLFTGDANSNRVNDPGECIDLQDLGGDVVCGYGINDAAHVVGTAEDSQGRMVPFVWESGTGMIPLLLGTQFSVGEAFDINDGDPLLVVGVAQQTIGYPPLGPPIVWRKVSSVWSIITLPTSQGTGNAYAIDSSAQIVGQICLSAQCILHHASLWTPPLNLLGPEDPLWTLHDLGTLECNDENCELLCDGCPASDNSSSVARALPGRQINESPLMVAGTSQLSFNDRAFRFVDDGPIPHEAEPGEMEDLGVLVLKTLGSTLQLPKGESRGVSPFGQVVGRAYSSGSIGAAFIWAGRMLALEKLIETGSCRDKEANCNCDCWELLEATALSTCGHIVGRGHHTQGNHQDRAYLLTPSIDVVDPNPHLLDGPSVSADREALSSFSPPRVKGLAADGVTRVVLRFMVPGPGTVTFTVKDDADTPSTDATSVGELSDPIAGGAAQNPLNVDVKVPVSGTDGRYIAMAVLKAPVDFVRSAETRDKCSSKRPLTIMATWTSNQSGTGCDVIVATRELELHRPPVMLIHGIWGSSHTWRWSLDLDESLDTACDSGDQLTVFIHEYVESNTASFLENIVQPRSGIAAAVQLLRDRKIAATQADVFAHSMGGVLTRLYAADIDDSFKRTGNLDGQDNYDAGDIHKLITVDSPHYGSPWGCAFLDNVNGDPTPLGTIASWVLGCVDCGGLFDMLPESQAFASSVQTLLKQNELTTGKLPAISRPVAVLAGTGGSDCLNNVPDCPCAVVALAIRALIWWQCGFVCDPANPINVLFSSEDHDIAVTKSSQLGGLAAQNCPYPLDPDPPTDCDIFHCLGGIHMSPGVPGNSDASVRAVQYLNAAVASMTQGFGVANPEGCPPLTSAARQSSPAVAGSILITSPAADVVVVPGTSVSISIAGVGGYQPQGVVALSEYDAQSDECSETCSAVPLSVPLEAVGRLTLSAFAYSDAKDVEGTLAEAAPVRVNIIPNGNVLELRPEPRSLYLFDYSPRRRLGVRAVYDETDQDGDPVIRVFSGCHVPGCCTATCDQYEDEECDAFLNDVKYSILDPSVAMVDCQGFVTARAVGRTTVIATYLSDRYGQCMAENKVCTASAEVVVVSIPCDYNGDGVFDLLDNDELTICCGGSLKNCSEFMPSLACRNAFDLDHDYDIDGMDTALCLGSCPGFDVSIDSDADGTPDGCDTCPGIGEYAQGDSCSLDLRPVSEGVTTINNYCATTDASEWVQCESGEESFGSDIWFSYTTTGSGHITISMCDTADYDAILGVYHDPLNPSECVCPENGASLVGSCADDTCGQMDGPAILTTAVGPGKCYVIRVGGGDGAQGTGSMNLSFSLFCPRSSAPKLQTQFDGSGFPELKNRVIAINAGDPGQEQTIRVTWDAMPNWPDGHELLVGQQKWMAEPFQACENSGDGLATSPPNCGPSPGQPQRWFWAANLTCDSAAAHFTDLTMLMDFCTGSGEACTSDVDCAAGTCGVDGVIHLLDQGIAPSKNDDQQATYSVQVIESACAITEGNFSDALVVTQPVWGDIGDGTGCPMLPPEGVARLIPDVTQALNKFANGFCAPKKTRGDVNGETLNFKVDISDVLALLNAFSNGIFTPEAGPACVVGG